MDAPADKTTPAIGKTTPASHRRPARTRPKATVEGWHSNEIIKCIKRDGSWENEDGETIQVEGWRLIEEPKEGEPPREQPPPRPKKETAPYAATQAPRKKK